MAFVSHFFDDYFKHYRRHLLDQHFGLALTPDDVLLIDRPMTVSREYYRPWRQLSASMRDFGSSIKSDKDKFQVNLDVQQFSPEDITVKTADGYVIVEAKHDEKKDDHGYISRQFVRKYPLPEGTLPETVESKLSSNGVLTITAPKTVPEAIKGVREVPIMQTGPVRKNVKNQIVEYKPPKTEEKKEEAEKKEPEKAKEVEKK